MGTHEIRAWPDPWLSATCEPVTFVDALTRALAGEMLETMYAAGGRGLAAPQIGVGLRLFVMDPDWKDGEPAPVVCINPEITWSSPEIVATGEVCLSIPGVVAHVERPAQVHMRWTDSNGAPQEADLGGFAAILAQHETDHLDGIVTLDRVSEKDRETLLSEYLG